VIGERLEVARHRAGLTTRALAEDLIAESQATELLGMPLAGYLKQEKKAYGEFPVGVCGNAGHFPDF